MKEKSTHLNSKMSISKLEKELLKNFIFKSVDKHILKINRRKYVIGMVASITILIGLTHYNNKHSNESINYFIKSTEKIDYDNFDKVLLILGEGKNLKINEETTTINYSSSGKKVTIGDEKEVIQQVNENNKTVYNTIMVPFGKRSKIYLSDGSKVWLNSGSKLVYPAVFKNTKREVYLEGEAIFDVKHNKQKPFFVISNNQEIEVLGTVFGVTNYLNENSVNTVLKSGSVQISYKNNSRLINTDKLKISPGTLAQYNKEDKSIVSSKVDVSNYFSWRDGILIFKNNSLEYIMNRLSRFYKVNIIINNENLMKETYSGYLDLNDNINTVIKNIQKSTNMNYTLNKSEIIISS